MDRILRPNGYVIIRESSYIVEVIIVITKGMNWDCNKAAIQNNIDTDNVLICQKKFWYSKQSS